MTIGIAAFGPTAGAGIIAGLRAVEKIGRGAIGGFVSLVILSDDGRLLRASVQDGGAEALFPEEIPLEIAQAQFAGLISSGPNRPEPLSQFVTAEIGVGIVTGHRMPHTKGKDKIALNSMVLAEMASGRDPQAAIDHVSHLYPDMDAGFLAISVDGRLGIGNCRSVLARGDNGMGILDGKSGAAKVATIHNAIFPHTLVSTLANHVAMDTMFQQRTPEHWIIIKSGITLKSGSKAQVYIDSSSKVEHIVISNNSFLNGSWAVGLGDIVEVISGGVRLGWLGYEPFISLLDGKIMDIDGYEEIKLPVFAQHPYL
jgi:hypothetical protein